MPKRAWHDTGVQNMVDAMECLIDGNGQIWAKHNDYYFATLQKKEYATYRPGKGIDGKDLQHGYWKATETGIQAFERMKKSS